jgi:hypothetical protein
MSAPNKYGVHNRLNLLESRCTALEQQNAELRTALWTALETKLNDKARVIRDSIKDGVDGKDGETIVGPQGIQGPAGDVLYVGPQEVKAAAQRLRAEKVLLRAKYQAALFSGNCRC